MAAIKNQLYAAKLVSIVAATITSLACGTGYAFSAWGPAFAERMVLSSTETNLIGAFGNLGMYGAGIPLGYMVDSKGPRMGSAVGCLAMGLGYFALYRTYLSEPGSVPLPLICLFTFVAGCGGSSAFGASIKTATMNFPKNRGTATAFPVAAFGLSAFFFSLVSSLALPNDTSGFLLFLSIGTFLMISISAFFLRIVPGPSSYVIIPSGTISLEMERRKPSGLRRREASSEPGTRNQSAHTRKSSQDSSPDSYTHSETPSMSQMDTADFIPDELQVNDTEVYTSAHGSLYADIRGFALLRVIEFYQLFFIVGILTGIGLMTINNIGSDAQALWSHWDQNIPIDWIRHRQSLHVSIISIGSATGRLCSGIGSDIIVERFQMSRVWCFVVSSGLFCLAQICGVALENPSFLFILSSSTGLAYGFLFGVGPSITADTFGVGVVSSNWGALTLSPLVFSNLFNLVYGHIYDSNSNILPSGHRECLEGRLCYKNAYWMTLGGSAVAVVFCLWTINHGGKAREQQRKQEQMSHLA